LLRRRPFNRSRAPPFEGGHLVGESAVDILFTGSHVLRYASTRIATRNLHGTGCTLSSAIAANIVLGQNLIGAIGPSKIFTHEAIAAARRVKLGGGPGPLIQYTPLQYTPRSKPAKSKASR
jgi:hydroxymethylpyrimidine/phosphomethylpyrimidine kinase